MYAYVKRCGVAILLVQIIFRASLIQCINYISPTTTTTTTTVVAVLVVAIIIVL